MQEQTTPEQSSLEPSNEERTRGIAAHESPTEKRPWTTPDFRVIRIGEAGFFLDAGSDITGAYTSIYS